MRRLAGVVLVSLAAFVAAIAVFSSPGRRGCPLAADKDGSYSSRFEGSVSLNQSTHVLRVTRDGRPVSGAEVCINTEMAGMSGMGYTARGHELNPGRYRVGFRYAMPGDYRANVVTRKGAHEVSTPLTVKVGLTSPASGAGARPGRARVNGSQAAHGKGCPQTTGKAGSYSGSFAGRVTMDQSDHVLRVTRAGRPVSGAKVCVNAAMEGMSSMRYTARGQEVGPGRYRVPIRFRMAGPYRGNVVTAKGGRKASIPLSVKVGPKG